MSQRITDQNGWMYIAKNPISKAGVFPYLGSEIGAPESGRVYNVLRPPEELEAAAKSFGLLPLIDEHELLGAQGTSTDKRPPAGFTGENVTYEHPYLYAPIKVTSPKLIEAIKNGKVELSPSYFLDWEKKEGTYEGKPYDYVQRIKGGNHLALVATGRSGADVAVLDHRTYTFDTGEAIAMTLEQMLAAVAALSEEEKAQLLGALAPATDDENPEDEELVTDDELDQEEPEEAEDAPAAIGEAELDEDVTVTEAVENAEAILEAAKELKDKIASDAMKNAVQHIDARNTMVARVKPFVGAIPVTAMDSAESVAAYALKKFGVKHSKCQATAVIHGYLHGRKPEAEKTVAMDSKPVSAQSTVQKFWKE